MSEEQKSSGSKIPPPVARRFPVKSGPGRLARWIWAPVSAEGQRVENFCRGCCRVVIIVGQEFVRDRIPLRASALTFTVVLAMVPTLALGTAVLKGLGFGGEIRQAAHSFISQLEVTAGEFGRGSSLRASRSGRSAAPDGAVPDAAVPDAGAVDAPVAAPVNDLVDTPADTPDDTSVNDQVDGQADTPAAVPVNDQVEMQADIPVAAAVTAPADILAAAPVNDLAAAPVNDLAAAPVNDLAAIPEDDPGGPGEAPEASLSEHLHRVADTLFDYVDKTNFATMGLIGVLVLLLTVFSVLDSIENTFNHIWQARSGRSLGKKLTDYLALLVILPLTINFGVAAMAALQNPGFLLLVEFWVPWLGLKVMSLLPVLAVVATFTTLYSFLPNTRVTKTAALTGGIFGGIGWLLLQAVYFKLQIVVVRYNAIYGSFAALPLFLLWIHFSWMIFLMGAEVSFGVQIWRRYLWKKLTLSPSGRLGLAFEILAVAAGDYRHKRLTTRDSLVWTLKQPDAYIKELLDLLHRAGLMRHVEDAGGSYVPSAPLAELDPVEIADLLWGDLPPAISADNPAVEALKAMRRSLVGRKLRPRE